MANKTKDRLAFRMHPETKRKIQQWYEADNCRSMNEFIEKAVNFYADYLVMRDSNALLPAAISSAMDGRLGLLEKNLSALSFNHAVELDMLTGIIAAAFEFDQDDLKRRRGQSVRNVKATNGRISLERRVQERREDEWQD